MVRAAAARPTQARLAAGTVVVAAAGAAAVGRIPVPDKREGPRVANPWAFSFCRPACHFFAFLALNSATYFAGSSLKASLQPEQQT